MKNILTSWAKLVVLLIGCLVLPSKLFAQQHASQSKPPFVPPDFAIPQVFETDSFRFRPLTPEDSALDFAAVMETKERLRKRSGGNWPADDFTVEQNRQDLVRHYQDFLDRIAFTYTVINLNESKVMGAIYINPPHMSAPEVDAEVFVWTAESEYLKGLDPVLLDAVKAWLRQSWPFKNVAFPYREMLARESSK